MTETNLDAFRSRYQARVENTLEQLLPSTSVEPARLHEALRYTVLGGGKRIRPLLTYAAGEALAIDPELLDRPACAVELIHAYSLIHDDLPAMDDDDLRRGQPTCHRAYDEATAILAGDALQTIAFQALAEAPGLSAESRVGMVTALARASGSRGMVGGQALDLAAEGEGTQLDVAMLEHIHIHKTGALIRASVQMALLARSDATDDQRERLDRYAKCIGLAFQIQDDVLDVEGDTALIGKTAGRDQVLEKATYPSLVGLAQAKAMARELTDEALSAISIFGERAAALTAIAEGLSTRRS
ncbi:(2E,6E)-farnesyl diphosphate synthase [Marichromatium gracile]|uniref:Farnesyl-diphosphate synthase n=1 Tax=Marichromatium gracile TaxID=1048 RepID=A0A4R4A6X9_MARGR|nr:MULTISPECIES: farnesyl diphosphate synthase [Marichromatium]MBO8084833.1 (2E,6E)-farnesyl diphosphate synthase [Marichromatium sp.]MBK1709662.1 (2E,6E)-farnesyl diphosphate synthase [Marichromatium gracile]MCF1181831.1 (2E,6E)-farnesyl diphosphate synthase [Marichromatium gracile]RNE90965.1 (2E,6E)-farnesyl diphosphate synthase [Marichromatium sp. AB31]RNE93344.1 (2E,6E)-farnesyl diphosphate synthase [Marichromatium sp. AB32]